jgi:hypothetical protein
MAVETQTFVARDPYHVPQSQSRSAPQKLVRYCYAPPAVALPWGTLFTVYAYQSLAVERDSSQMLRRDFIGAISRGVGGLLTGASPTPPLTTPSLAGQAAPGLATLSSALTTCQSLGEAVLGLSANLSGFYKNPGSLHIVGPAESLLAAFRAESTSDLL